MKRRKTTPWRRKGAAFPPGPGAGWFFEVTRPHRSLARSRAFRAWFELPKEFEIRNFEFQEILNFELKNVEFFKFPKF